MMKEQKGITLVALIITIIVMLILVAVTISIALNGGIFDQARRSTRATQLAQVKEAVALAKAEVLSDYYEKGAAYVPRTGAQFTNLIKQYLDEDSENLLVISSAANSAGTKYTVTISDTLKEVNNNSNTIDADFGSEVVATGN